MGDTNGGVLVEDADAAIAHAKLRLLQGILDELGSVVVAYSGGADSTFLLKVAHDRLGEGAMAATNRAANVPSAEVASAVSFCASQGIRHIMVGCDPLDLEGFADNPQDRCYICKRGVFSALADVASRRGARAVCDGTNTDDVRQYRPGLRALGELGVRSPLLEAGLTKGEVRLLSREMGIPTWDRPSGACLATRFEYGHHITAQEMARVERAEGALARMGFTGHVRVRVHGEIARVELPAEQVEAAARPDAARKISSSLKALGFTYVTLDLEGYRFGSMDAPLQG